MRRLLSSPYMIRRVVRLSLPAILLLWLKTYLVQRYCFDFTVTGMNQELVLLLNPLGPILAAFALIMLLFRQWQRLALLGFSLLTSLLLWSDLVYYRFFNDFLTLPVMFQSDHAGDLWSSVMFLLRPSDALLFGDGLVLAILLYRAKWKLPSWSKLEAVCCGACALLFYGMNWFLAENVRPDLLARTFDRQIVVKLIGAYNYHLYDAVMNMEMGTKRAFATNGDLTEVRQYLSRQPPDVPDPATFGIAKGRNVFLLSLESLQSFVLNRQIDGRELTPFLNSLMRESLNFTSFYHQTGQGKTSDAEFLIDTSLYPLPSGAVFFSHAHNTYHSVPGVLKKNGYYPAVFHANDPSFWNRQTMYKTMGYERFVSGKDYTITEENSVGWGLNDQSFFEQTVKKARELPQPFYSKLITLTNHYPFELKEEQKYIPDYTSGSKTLNRYIPTVRYMDEAVKVFFQRVKEAGLYDNSIFVLYGDHYGISQKHKKAMAQLLGKSKLTPYDMVQLQRVPLIIHIPGVKGRTIDTVAGQVDVKPTLLHLLGIRERGQLDFGHDILARNKPELAVFRDGSFITQDVVFTKSTCYKRSTGEVLTAELCEKDREDATAQLLYSDYVIFGDLMRFLESSRP